MNILKGGVETVETVAEGPSEEVRCRKVNPLPGFLIDGEGNLYRAVKQSVHSGGYRVVGVRIGHGRNSPTRFHFIHRLILEAFVGPCPEGMECRHLDGDPSNNRFDNLAWGTKVENSADARRHGTLRVGERHPFAKLNDTDIGEIVRLSKEGFTQKEIAVRFGVNQQNISGVLRNETYVHIPREIVCREPKLTPADVLEVVRLAGDGWATEKIARFFGITSGYVRDIVRGDARQGVER